MAKVESWNQVDRQKTAAALNLFFFFHPYDVSGEFVVLNKPIMQPNELFVLTRDRELGLFERFDVGLR